MNEQQAQLKTWIETQLAAIENLKEWETGNIAYTLLQGKEIAYKQVLKQLEAMES